MDSFNLRNFTGNSDFMFFIQYGHHEHSLGLHKHEDFFELTIVLEGTAMHNVNNESYFIKKGDVFGVTGETVHGFTECHDFRICNIMFKPEVIFAPFSTLKHIAGFHSLFLLEPVAQQYNSRLRLSLTDFEETERMLDFIINEYQNCKPGFGCMCTAEFIRLVGFLSRCYDEALIENDRLTTFARAVAYIENNFTEKISPEDIAAIAGLSVRHFQRQFKATYHIAPHEYILVLRMQKATAMLTDTSDTITDIALECGYHDPNLFSRQFRKHTGLSPREYRELNPKR